MQLRLGTAVFLAAALLFAGCARPPASDRAEGSPERLRQDSADSAPAGRPAEADPFSLAAVGGVGPARSGTRVYLAGPDVAVLTAPDGRSAVADLSMTHSSDPTRRAMWAAGREGVELSWAGSTDGSRHDITRDGKYLATVEGNSYRDTGVHPGQDADYIVSAASGGSAGRNTWGFRVTVPQVAALDAAGLRTSALGAVRAAQASQKVWIVYETFIPEAFLPSPNGVCGPYSGSSYSFGGDGRGFSPNDLRFRTKLFVTVDWAAGGRVTTTAQVGTTHVYTTVGKRLVAQKTASSANLWVKPLALSNASSVDLRFSARAGDPFCQAFPNGIDSVFTLTVTRNRSWYIMSGSHRMMPNHEIYLKEAGYGPWVTVYQRRGDNSLCLVNGACARGNMSGVRGVY